MHHPYSFLTKIHDAFVGDPLLNNLMLGTFLREVLASAQNPGGSHSSYAEI